MSYPVTLPKRQQGDFQNNAMIVMDSTDITSRLKGWGNNSTGVLANGSIQGWDFLAQEPTFDPNTVLPPTGTSIADWAFTNANLYVVYSNGWVYSAGANDYGQLGHGDTLARPYLKRIEYFVQNQIQITKVWAAGSASASNGGGCVYFQTQSYTNPLYACGANGAGNLGNAATPTSNISTPAPCAGITNTSLLDVKISANGGNFSAYALDAYSYIYVAGLNNYGQLGVGNTNNVTGSFVRATAASGGYLIGVTAVSVTDLCALAVTSSSVWATGYNGYGQLGLGDTTNRNQFTQISGLSGISKAEVGGGTVAYAYAFDSSNTLYTWGYNGQNNLFKNNTTSPVTTPSTTVLAAGQIVKVFFPRGDQLGGNSQLFAQTAGNQLIYAGVDNGQQGVPNTTIPGAYKIVLTPQFDTIADVFVHGTGGNQRLFVVASTGFSPYQNLYACGYNQDSICYGGFSSNNMPAYVDGELVPLGSVFQGWF